MYHIYLHVIYVEYSIDAKSYKNHLKQNYNDVKLFILLHCIQDISRNNAVGAASQ